jgi:hypothetical protein
VGRPQYNFGNIVTLQKAGLTMELQPGFSRRKKDEHCDQRATRQGIGHGGIDFGAGYAYLNPMTGIEFSGVGGFIYNFKNTATRSKSQARRLKVHLVDGADREALHRRELRHMA